MKLDHDSIMSVDIKPGMVFATDEEVHLIVSVTKENPDRFVNLIILIARCAAAAALNKQVELTNELTCPSKSRYYQFWKQLA